MASIFPYAIFLTFLTFARSEEVIPVIINLNVTELLISLKNSKIDNILHSAKSGDRSLKVATQFCPAGPHIQMISDLTTPNPIIVIQHSRVSSFTVLLAIKTNLILNDKVN